MVIFYKIYLPQYLILIYKSTNAESEMNVIFTQPVLSLRFLSKIPEPQKQDQKEPITFILLAAL